MFDTPLDELKPMLEALGLRVDTENVYLENDAEVYLGEERICVLHYSETEGGWDTVEFPVLFSPADHVINGIKLQLSEHLKKKERSARQLTFTVTIEYGAEVDKPTVKVEKALAALVAKSIRKLGPTDPKPKAVVVNGRRHSLRRQAQASR